MMRFARRLARTGNVVPGSMGEEVIAAANAGLIARSDAAALMIDYLGPALDTTISAISSALYLFAQHPDQWDAVRADRTLISNALNEVLRYEAPLRAFSRLVATDATIAGTDLRRGHRVLVLFASANRDEQAWDQPEKFNVERDATRHLGFGYGTHGCAGQGLARLEAQAVLSALAERVERIELTGEPVWGRNNIIRGLGTLPLRLHHAGGTS